MSTQRLYYDDAFLREFNARVLRCEPVPGGSLPAWSVLVDRSALFPASGGQPFDLGRLGDAQVLEVREEEGDVVHLVDQPLELGTVRGTVDWPRRFDHMQQHTGQHLLSAILQQRFGLQTVSFHLGTELSTIDIRGPEPSQDLLGGAEHAANKVIFEDRPVCVRYGTAEELAKLGVRKEVARAGILRAIEIEGVELQPCGGTHVRSTGQIGLLLIRRCTRIRQDWRVEFACGGRAERAARLDFLTLRGIAEKLSCPSEEGVAAVERTILERDKHFKNARAAWQRVAELEAVSALEATPPSPGRLRTVAQVFQADSPEEFMGFFAAQSAKSEKTVALCAHSESGHLLFTQHPSAGGDMAVLLKLVLAKLGGKGGGTRDFARGRLRDPAQVQLAIHFAKAHMNL